MPYARTADLPPAVRHLPPHAQGIFLATFNNAWETYANRGPQAQEEIPFRVAWAAVKKQYRKRGSHWVPKAAVGINTRRPTEGHRLRLRREREGTRLVRDGEG
jgi:cation transport regulator